MRKVFRQKYLLHLLTALTLVLIALNIVLPKIEEYNERVREEQQRLYREASGAKSRAVSFGIYDNEAPHAETRIFFLSILFLSLILTKKVTLSFLSLLLFSFLLYGLTNFIHYAIRKAGFYDSFLSSDYFGLLLIAGELILSFWIGAFICRVAKCRFQNRTLFK